MKNYNACKEFFKNVSPFNNREEMSPVLFVVKKVLAFWLCYMGGALVGEGAVILLFIALGKNVFIGEMFSPQTMLLIKYYGYILTIGVALLYWKKIEKKPLSDMGLTKKFGNYFIGVILGISLVLLCTFLIILTGSMQYTGIFKEVDILLVFLFIGGFVVQGATEEILCRGIVLHSLKEKTSTKRGVIVSTLLFILPHTLTLWEVDALYGCIGIVNLVLISIILSALTLRYKSIWAACGLHSFWNAVLYCVLGLNVSGSEESVAAIFRIKSIGENICNGGIYGMEASIVTMVVLAIIAVIMIKGKGRAA